MIRTLQNLCGSSRRRMLQIGLAAILLRALIPIGYMPGNLLAGEVMVLCPTGLPSALAESLHVGHNAHNGHADTIVDADRDCPIGSALQPAWLPHSVADLFSATRYVAEIFGEYADSPIRTIVSGYDSRAPPFP